MLPKVKFIKLTYKDKNLIDPIKDFVLIKLLGKPISDMDLHEMPLFFQFDAISLIL